MQYPVSNSNPSGRSFASAGVRVGAFLALVLVSAPAFAVTTSDSVQGISVAEKSRPRNFGIAVGLAYETSLQEKEDPNHIESLYLTTSPFYRWSDQFKTSLNLITRQQLTGDIDYHTHKSTLSTSWTGKELNPYLTMRGAVSFGLPLSKDRRERESYLTGISLLPELDLDMTRAGMPWLSAAYLFNPARLFHRFYENTNGTSNKEYSLTNDLTVSFQFSQKWSFSSEYIYATQWTYNGAQTNTFEWDQTIAYSVTPTMNISGGIGTSGDTLKNDGFSPAVSLFDGQATTVSVGIDIKI